MTTPTDNTEYDDNDVAESTTETDADDWTPPTKEDYERLLAESRKASAEAASRKRLLRELGYDKNGNRLDSANSSADDSEENRRSQPAVPDSAVIEKTVAKKYAAIYAGLATAGVPGGQLERVAGLINASAVVVDEDGIEGLAEQIDSLKSDWPELFKRSRPKATDAAVVGGGKKTVSSTAEARTWQDEIRDRFAKGFL